MLAGWSMFCVVGDHKNSACSEWDVGRGLILFYLFLSCRQCLQWSRARWWITKVEIIRGPFPCSANCPGGNLRELCPSQWVFSYQLNQALESNVWIICGFHYSDNSCSPLSQIIGNWLYQLFEKITETQRMIYGIERTGMQVFWFHVCKEIFSGQDFN